MSLEDNELNGIMDKKRLALLEKAFGAEIDAALKNRQLHIMQTKSALAEKLVEEGLLRKVSMRIAESPWPCTIYGYELTHLGRMAYCMSCPDIIPLARAVTAKDFGVSREN